ncbi:sensor histidine kinase [Cryobacterium tepidiphilum]|uniref:sensor histidine kinase n=1 Tax=Cryobacterium tepidiphilum TaxID=2486026 RepID=UPI00131449C4|nr:histidine kinase [Cryobacterium tepidiphilum]
MSFVPVRGDMVWYTTPYAFLIAVGFATGIALSRVATSVSLVIVGALLATQLLFWAARFSSTSWSAYLTLLVFATLVGLHATRRMRVVAPLVLILCAVVVSALLVLPRFSATGIDGLINGKHMSTVALIPDLLVCAGAAALITFGFWYLGTQLRLASPALRARSSEALSPILRNLAPTLLTLRPALEPAIAVAFYGLWIIAEAGRSASWPWPSFPFTLGLLAASIAVARSFPRLAVALPGVLLATQLFVIPTRFGSTTWPVYFAVPLTCLIVSAMAGGRIRWLSLPIAVVYVAAITTLMTVPPLSDGYGWTAWVGVGTSVDNVVGSFAAVLVVGLILTSGAWYIGYGLRASQLKRAADAKLDATVDELRSAEIDLIVANERDRIAQDVHDIMAHSLAVIIAQADGARFIGPQRPDAISASLERIAASARTSLAEVRMLIESLVESPEGHSNPTLDDLDDLVQRMRGAGLAITVDRFGDQTMLTPGQQLAVYRIVQESLTNALKHAGALPTARLTLDWRGPGLALTVASSGALPQRRDSNARGRGHSRGLYGMRERARLAGGWLTADVDDEEPGGYLVTAFVPTACAVEQASEAAPEVTLLHEAGSR